MSIPVRAVAALLALIALAATQVELAWASACAPGMDVPGMQMPGADGHDHGAPAPDAPADDDGSAPADCPLGPTAAAGCAVAALPVLHTRADPPPADPSVVAPADGRDLGRLAASSLFRPPQR